MIMENGKNYDKYIILKDSFWHTYIVNQGSNDECIVEDFDLDQDRQTSIEKCFNMLESKILKIYKSNSCKIFCDSLLYQPSWIQNMSETQIFDKCSVIIDESDTGLEDDDDTPGVLNIMTL